MTALNRTRLAAVIGGAIFIAGMTIAVRAVVQLGRDGALCDQRRQDLADLQTLGERVARFEAVRAGVRAQAAIPPEPDTTALLRETFPDVTPDVRRSRLALDGGWTREDIELALSNASVARIFQFIEAAERARPPLRLVKVDIRSRPGAGQVDAVLTLVRLLPDA